MQLLLFDGEFKLRNSQGESDVINMLSFQLYVITSCWYQSDRFMLTKCKDLRCTLFFTEFGGRINLFSQRILHEQIMLTHVIECWRDANLPRQADKFREGALSPVSSLTKT